jgi:putative DNA primase/helicase
MTAADDRLAALRRLHLLSDPEAGSALAFPAEREVASAPRLRSVTAEELLTLTLPQREYALAPVLPLPGLAMLYAPRGIGKTFVALSIALAVASGGAALKWRAPKPRRVLYVDGEMPAGQMQERLARLIRAADAHPPEADFLRFVSADLEPEGLPSIARPETQRALEAEIAATGAEVVIFDNLSTLAAGLRENESDDWAELQAWLLSLRRAGRCVLLIHHAGKAGQQRGTSRREDALDSVIALRRPADYGPERGAAFETHLEKARGVTGADATPFAAELVETPDGGLTWSWRDLGDERRARAAELLAAGMSIRDVAEETGLSRSAVHRLKQAQGAAHGRA